VSDILRIPVDRELSDRVRWLVTLRWPALLLALILTFLAGRWMGDVLPMGALWATLGIIALYNAALWVISRRLISPGAPYECHAFLLHFQVFVDLFTLTMLLHFSGGLENPFSAYYLFVVVVGSILMTRRAAYVYAAAASFLWTALLMLEASGILPHHNLAGFRLPGRYLEPMHIISEAFVLASACFGVAYLSSNVVERLREEERELYEASSSCELRAGELAELNRQLQESNLSCELRAGELASLNLKLQELDKARSLFIRLVTHELRAPVAAIQSYLRLILDGYVPQERLQEIIAKAEQRACDQLELIGDLLDLARTQDVKDATVIKPVDGAAILHDIVDMMQARIQDKGLTLNMQVSPDSPLVLASEEHVKQVWTNLVSNAIKYTPDGGEVTITWKPLDGERVQGIVQDTGIGMAPEEAKRVFDTFYRTEAAKAMSHHGTGLGLSIVQGIMARYHGRIWVESEVGKGSTFYFELPAAKPE
jgi:signal transduction histidine kinase